jgi:hypothetical protein
MFIRELLIKTLLAFGERGDSQAKFVDSHRIMRQIASKILTDEIEEEKITKLNAIDLAFREAEIIS